MSNTKSYSICSLVKLTHHFETVLSVAFSPNGEFLASGSSDCTIIIWKTHQNPQRRLLLSLNHSIFAKRKVFGV